MDEFENFYGRKTRDDELDAKQDDQNIKGLEADPKSNSFYSYSYVNADEPRKFSPYDTPKKMKKKGFGKTLARCIAIALVFGLVAGGVFSGVMKITGSNIRVKTVYYGTNDGENGSVSSTSTKAVQTKTDVSDIVESVMPSIVAITNTSEKEITDFFGQSLNKEQHFSGSGIIIGQDDEQLLIVTNNHVVEGASNLSVSFIDKKVVSATIKGTSPSSDLAIISVKLNELSAATLEAIKVAIMGDSKVLKVGEPTIAIGNALGYGQSVTTGVVSALDRSITVEDVTCKVVQTDAAINPGNSGGALLNIKGEVIGINSSKYADAEVEGIGFAIPISDAQPIIDKLITREAVDPEQQAYLGLYGVDVSEEVSAAYKMPVGVYVTQVVENQAADKYGIRAGDVITKFNGEAVTKMEQLQEQLQLCKAGDKVEVVVQRPENGQYKSTTIKVKLSSINDKTD